MLAPFERHPSKVSLTRPHHSDGLLQQEAGVFLQHILHRPQLTTIKKIIVRSGKNMYFFDCRVMGPEQILFFVLKFVSNLALRI